ncbi:Nn.00g073920.m01.CDS01 [Neocucurbitaria sp. VM-36]
MEAKSGEIIARDFKRRIWNGAIEATLGRLDLGESAAWLQWNPDPAYYDGTVNSHLNYLQDVVNKCLAPETRQFRDDFYARKWFGRSG